jgi:hypothetical protein
MKRPRVKLIDDSAFAIRREKVHSPKPDGWLRSLKHLAFVRTLRCANCGTDENVEAAHVRKGTDGGKGVKPSDIFTNPLCVRCHKIQHTVGEPTFWNLDPIALALEHAVKSPCDRAKAAGIEEWRRRYG